MDSPQLHIVCFCSRNEVISKVAEDIVWQKELLDFWVMFPSLIAWKKEKSSLRRQIGCDL